MKHSKYCENHACWYNYAKRCEKCLRGTPNYLRTRSECLSKENYNKLTKKALTKAGWWRIFQW